MQNVQDFVIFMMKKRYPCILEISVLSVMCGGSFDQSHHSTQETETEGYL